MAVPTPDQTTDRKSDAAVAEEQEALDAAHDRRCELVAELTRRTEASAEERSVTAEALRRTRARVVELEQADRGLVFGRLDATDGTVHRIGRVGVPASADDADPLVIDWRAEAARPFYTATAIEPQGQARRPSRAGTTGCTSRSPGAPRSWARWRSRDPPAPLCEGRGMTDSAASDPGIVVVGAGECGTQAAMTLRDKGFDGPITLIGSEDVHAYERPPLSKASLAEDESELVHPWTPEQLEEAGISLRLGVEVTGIDRERRVVATRGGAVPYDRLLLALGSRARRLDLDHVHYLRTHKDAAALRDALREGGRLLVIGAGFIGLEVAAGARERGLDVTVVEAADRALARAVPEVIAERVVALHADHGVAIRTGTTVTAVADEGSHLRATLSTGEVLGADAVVAGVGAEPVTEIAAAAGLLVEDGIVVDELLRTSDPHVWAAGDCASYPDPRSGQRVRIESWRSAHDQGASAAAAMLGQAEPHAAVAWFWSDQYDQMLQTAGVPGAGERAVLRTREDGTLLHLGLTTDGQVVAASSLGRGPVVAKDIRVAEQLIAAGASPAVSDLEDPGVPLRSLLTTG